VVISCLDVELGEDPKAWIDPTQDLPCLQSSACSQSHPGLPVEYPQMRPTIQVGQQFGLWNSSFHPASPPSPCESPKPSGQMWNQRMHQVQGIQMFVIVSLLLLQYPSRERMTTRLARLKRLISIRLIFHRLAKPRARSITVQCCRRIKTVRARELEREPAPRSNKFGNAPSWKPCGYEGIASTASQYLNLLLLPLELTAAASLRRCTRTTLERLTPLQPPVVYPLPYHSNLLLCNQKLTERDMHVMHTYIKLIHLRLKDNMPDQQCVDQVQNSRICELMSVLDARSEGIPEF
jgi:hypothetical protein